MLKRKMIAFLITYLLFGCTLALVLVANNKMYGDFFFSLLMVGAYSFPLILFYGVPSSILADYLTKRISGISRGVISLFIHLVMGMGIVALAGIIFENKTLLMDLKAFWSEYLIFLIPTLLAAFIFWMSDELVRCRFIQTKCTLLSNKLEKYKDLRI